MLIVDVRASGNLGGTSQSKRELAAEVAGLLAVSAIRNNDKVDPLLFNDRLQSAQLAQAQLTETMRVLRQNRIDRIDLRTGDDYLPALRSFFKQRERRMMVR